MKNTRANVEEYAKSKGYTPIQIDGIPEGFSFSIPNLQIGEINHLGGFVAYIPNTKSSVSTHTIEKLQEVYLEIRNAK